MLYVLGLFLACFIPFLCALVVKMRRGGGPRLNIIYNFTATIVYLNSSLNPFVYCFRLKDIRIAVFKVLGRKYTIDMNGEQVPVSRSHSNQKLNNLKCSNQNVYIPLSTVDISKAPETIVQRSRDVRREIGNKDPRGQVGSRERMYTKRASSIKRQEGIQAKGNLVRIRKRTARS